MSEIPVPAISRNHQRALTSRLRALDESLCQFERWARLELLQSVLFAEKNSLSARQRQQILEETAHLREVLTELRDDLGLRREVSGTRQAVAADCAYLWEVLIELEPRYLKNYGAVSDELADYLQPRLARIQQAMERLGQIVGEKRTEELSTQAADNPD